MGDPVAADAHTLGLQVPHVFTAQECGTAQPPRTYKKSRGQPFVKQNRQRQVHVRNVAVIKSQENVRLISHEVKDRLELFQIEPTGSLRVINLA